MAVLENRFVSVTARDLLDSATPLTGQLISGSADAVDEYEKQLATLFGRARAVAVASGTVSIYCAMRAVGVGPGTEVILPATAVVMSGLPALMLGASVRFADTTPEPGFGLHAPDVESLITEKTRAILSVPLWGYPVPMDQVSEVCRRRNVALLEDVAQSHGTTWKGRYLGTFGAAGCFSTHERKLITTGEGGFVLTDDAKIADVVNTLRRYGINELGAGHALGLNLKLSAFAAALGRTQARKLDDKIAARGLVAQAIREGLSSVEWLREVSVAADSRQNYYALALRVMDPNISVKALEKYLASREIISDTFRYGFQPLYRYPLFAEGARICPNAERLISEVITVPSHEGMKDADVGRVVDAIRSFPGGRL